MNAAFLQRIGLQVEDDEATSATFEPASALINPVSRQLMQRITFTIVGDRLVATDPPSLVGSPPIALTRIERSAELEEQLNAALNEIILAVQRRSADFQALGISARVSAETLLLDAEVESAPFVFSLQSDKRGAMRIVSATRDGLSLPLPEAATFDVSEFRERGALANYLRALFGDPQETMEVEIHEDSVPPPPPLTVTFGELSDGFGRGAQLPATTPLEILVEMRVGGESLRFAAARISGRTFRGLLAGAKGKVWAGRFEIGEFPGVVALVAEHLRVPMEEVRIIGEDGEEQT